MKSFSMCVLGNRLLKLDSINDCHKNVTGFLHKTYCGNETSTRLCDPYYKDHNLTIVRGIKGISSGVFFGKCTCGTCLTNEHTIS